MVPPAPSAPPLSSAPPVPPLPPPLSLSQEVLVAIEPELPTTPAAKNLGEFNELLVADGADPIGDDEYDAFEDWCDQKGMEMHVESYCDWTNTCT